MKILIIDDIRDIANLFSEYLIRKGHDCVIQNNADHALELLRNGSFDLVLLDLAMRDYNGFDLLDDLKKENMLSNQKIIICTASSSSESEISEIMDKYDVEICLKKPIKLRSLSDAIDDLFH